jgi:hypothetical protein
MQNVLQDPGYANFLKTHGLIAHISKLDIPDVNEFLPVIYKVCSTISSTDELENFAKFLNKIYESGYYKSAEDHKKALAAMGLNTSLIV